MEITNISIRLIKTPASKIKGFASVTFDHSLVIHDFKIVEGKRGLFVGMPSKKINESEYREMVIPATTQMNDILQTQILRAYQDEISKPGKKM